MYIYLKIDKYVDKMREINKPNAADHLRKGEEHVINNQFERALSEYTSALRLEPKNIDAHLGRAAILLRLDKKEDAYEETKIILTLDPQNTMAHYMKGTIFMLLGDEKSALIEYREVIKLDPANSDAYKHITLLYISQRDYIEADKILNDAVKAFNSDPETKTGFIELQAQVNYAKLRDPAYRSKRMRKSENN